MGYITKHQIQFREEAVNFLLPLSIQVHGRGSLLLGYTTRSPIKVVITDPDHAGQYVDDSVILLVTKLACVQQLLIRLFPEVFFV